jgi:ribonuclease HI
MPPPLACHISYANGASPWTQNLASAAWALYSPSHKLLHSSDTCLGSTTNNQAEYMASIGLLTETCHHHICHLSVLLDSQIVVLHLNNLYRVRDPFLFRKYLQVRLLSRYFDSITFTHIPRQLNQTTSNMANLVLDWHLSHQATNTHTSNINNLS